MVSSEVTEDGNEVLKSSHEKVVVKSSLNPRSLPFVVKDKRVSEKSKNFKVISEGSKVSNEKLSQINVSSQEKSSQVVQSSFKICSGKSEVKVKPNNECKMEEKHKSTQNGEISKYEGSQQKRNELDLKREKSLEESNHWESRNKRSQQETTELESKREESLKKMNHWNSELSQGKSNDIIFLYNLLDL